MDVYGVCLKGRVGPLWSVQSCDSSFIIIGGGKGQQHRGEERVRSHGARAPVPLLLHVIVARLAIFSALIKSTAYQTHRYSQEMLQVGITCKWNKKDFLLPSKHSLNKKQCDSCIRWRQENAQVNLIIKSGLIQLNDTLQLLASSVMFKAEHCQKVCNNNVLLFLFGI